MNISAVIPVKNGEKYIFDSIVTLTENMRETDEIIYVDDNSIDKTRSQLLKMAKKHKNIRLLNNPGYGIVDALNFGIKNSKNNWIARFDVDDIYSRDRIERQRQLISEGVVAIFCDYMFIDVNGKSLGKILSPVFDSANIWSLVRSQRTPHPGVIFSKTAFNLAGKYLANDFPAEDVSLWWRISKYGKLISVPEILLYYKLHNLSVTATKKNHVNLKRNEVISLYSQTQPTSNLNFFRSVYKKYKMMPDSSERQILAIRDYYAFINYFDTKQKVALYLLVYIPKIIFNPKKLVIVVRLYLERKKRSSYKSTLESFA